MEHYFYLFFSVVQFWAAVGSALATLFGITLAAGTWVLPAAGALIAGLIYAFTSFVSVGWRFFAKILYTIVGFVCTFFLLKQSTIGITGAAITSFFPAAWAKVLSYLIYVFALKELLVATMLGLIVGWFIKTCRAHLPK